MSVQDNKATPSKMETNKLEIFETAKRLYAAIGFIPKKERFYVEQWLRTVEGFLANVMVLLYLLVVADTVKEYMTSIFMTTGGYIENWYLVKAVYSNKIKVVIKVL